MVGEIWWSMRHAPKLSAAAEAGAADMAGVGVVVDVARAAAGAAAIEVTAETEATAGEKVVRV